MRYSQVTWNFNQLPEQSRKSSRISNENDQALQEFTQQFTINAFQKS